MTKMIKSAAYFKKQNFIYISMFQRWSLVENIFNAMSSLTELSRQASKNQPHLMEKQK